MANYVSTRYTHYRFSVDGEKRLTEWMRSHLAYAFAVAPKGNIETIEEDLIAELTPPLNLTDRQNPQASQIDKRRAACRSEAREAAGINS